ncbi:hypothetical protein BaRGS_00040238 [Batillaria attramentaria]|uniref:Macro domain-containing protein n=1 Tax=Batillaria attramentaria TaxID=370345 RepID=A0ABD0J1J3_9CAEN
MQRSHNKRVILTTHFNIFLYSTCFWIQNGTLPYLSKKLGADPVVFGYLQTTFAVVQLAGGPLFGRFGDVFGGRAAMALAFLAAGLSYFLLGMAYSIPLLFLSRFPSVFMHAMQGGQMIVTDIGDSSQRADALGKLGMSYGVGMGAVCSVRCSGGSMLSMFMVLQFVPHQTKRLSTTPKTEGSSQSAGSVFSLQKMVTLVTAPGALYLLLIRFAAGIPIGVFQSMFQVVNLETFKLAPDQNGYLMSYIGITTMIVQGVGVGFVTKTFTESSTLVASSFILIWSYLLLAQVGTVWQLCVVCLPLVIGLTTQNVVITSALTHTVSEADTGAMLGLNMAVNSLVRTFSPTLGEDTNLYGHGGVSKALLKLCPRTYKSERDKMKKQKKELSHVYSCPSGRNGVGSCKFSFDTVYHAIVPAAGRIAGYGEKEWLDKMRQLYSNLFHAVDSDGKKSLALPLLGSGGAGASFDVAVKPLAHTLVHFQPKYRSRTSLSDIIVYVRENEAFSKLSSAVEKELQDKPSTPPTLDTRPGSVASHRPGSVQTKKEMSVKTGDVSKKAAVQTQLSQSDSEEDSNLPKILGLTPSNKSSKSAMRAEDIRDIDSNFADMNVHGECIEDSFRHHKPACPTCNTVYGIIIGNQPQGTMSVSRERYPHLPGYQNCGIIVIDYYFPNGMQGKEHPNPGQPYSGTRRRAFLPDCPEGREVCKLLRVSFENRLTFTVGSSRTTGAENVVTWNDIHHKTNIEGGPTKFGYPDPQYLSRLKEELAARGVTVECLKDEKWRGKFDV